MKIKTATTSNLGNLMTGYSPHKRPRRSENPLDCQLKSAPRCLSRKTSLNAGTPIPAIETCKRLSELSSAASQSDKEMSGILKNMCVMTIRFAVNRAKPQLRRQLRSNTAVEEISPRRRGQRLCARAQV